MSRKNIAASVFSVLLVALVSKASAGTFYNNESAFIMQLKPGSYVENFSNFTFGSPLNGTQVTWASPGANGYLWTASAVNGLYSNISALSTNVSNDPLTIMFAGLPVTAFGGNFANTDINGNLIAGTITITTSDGGTTSVTFGAAEGFIGYTSTVPITSISAVAAGAADNFVQIDHFYTGQAVPEPSTVALLAGSSLLGLTAYLRRRRARA